VNDFLEKLPGLAFSMRGVVGVPLGIGVCGLWQQYPSHPGQGREGRGGSLLRRGAARWGEGRGRAGDQGRPGQGAGAGPLCTGSGAPVGSRGRGSPRVAPSSSSWSTPWRWPSVRWAREGA
jgi:hypothetical protein